MHGIRECRWLLVVYGCTVFVSAFLLFQVQPLISKCILPWFGGSPAVWTTCMLFFQAMLFLGYAYAHVVHRKLSLRWQGVVHFTLLLSALSGYKSEPSTRPPICWTDDYTVLVQLMIR